MQLGGACYIHLTKEARLYAIELVSFDLLQKVIDVSNS